MTVRLDGNGKLERRRKIPTHARLLTLDGETLMLREWAKRTGIAETTIYWRLKHGWPADLALKTAPIVDRLRGTDGVFVSAIEPDEAPQ